MSYHEPEGKENVWVDIQAKYKVIMRYPLVPDFVLLVVGIVWIHVRERASEIVHRLVKAVVQQGVKVVVQEWVTNYSKNRESSTFPIFVRGSDNENTFENI